MIYILVATSYALMIGLLVLTTAVSKMRLALPHFNSTGSADMNFMQKLLVHQWLFDE